MTSPAQLSEPIPAAKDGEPAFILSAAEFNRLVAKVEAFANIQADLPLKIVKSDAGMKIVFDE